MNPALFAVEVAEGVTDAFQAELSEINLALVHARDQHRYWSWYARWRGGGPEYRAHCQSEATFYGSWVGRLEHVRDGLLGRLAACAASPYRYLH